MDDGYDGIVWQVVAKDELDAFKWVNDWLASKYQPGRDTNVKDEVVWFPDAGDYETGAN